jgi:16S rRNA (guanine527-N7)-methyltransferase
MFHVEHLENARRAATWAGVTLSTEQESALLRFAQWLEEEAIPAGGLGPREGPRIWQRHIADSLTMATALVGRKGTAVDLGTGVGLPGIPLAIALPELHWILLDRAGRRIRLLERACRILGLENVTAERIDAFRFQEQCEVVVSRGSLPLLQIVAQASRLLVPGGTAVVGVSRRADPPETLERAIGLAEDLGLDGAAASVPPEILDGPSWILIMHARGAI